VTPHPSSRPDRGFTLVEVLVALVVVALGLAALMVAVQGAARTSGYLRDKTLAQWIALNRLAEVRLTVNKLAAQASAQTSAQTSAGDTGQLDFASRTWHYDTRYFDTTFPGMKRVVVRVWAGDAKTKGNPITETTSFLGTSLGQPGLSNTDWTVGSTAATALCGPQAAGAAGGGAPVTTTTGGANGAGTNCTPAAGVPGVAPTITPPVGVGAGQGTTP